MAGSNCMMISFCIVQLGLLSLLLIFSDGAEAAHIFRAWHGILPNASSLDCEGALRGGSSSRAAARHGVVHRHGPCSPLKPKNPSSATLSEMISGDAGRVRYLQSKIIAGGGAPSTLAELAASDSALETPVTSGFSVGTGNYLVQVGLGTPTRDLLLIIDTGSEVTWTQCLPCASVSGCYQQQAPIFDPADSTTYTDIACGSSDCALLGNVTRNSCSAINGLPCQYNLTYLDRSFTTGDFATDTLTIGNLSISNYAFGCGHDNQGLFKGSDGLLGLNTDSFSFPSQTRSIFNGTFAYCLTSPFALNSSGFIEFGTTASPTASITPLVAVTPPLPFYFVVLEAIIVGEVLITPSVTALMVVDSGTVITRLDPPLYTAVSNAFNTGTAALTPAPAQVPFDTCYTISANEAVEIPVITFQLMDGVNFAPRPVGLLYPVNNIGTYCVAFSPMSPAMGFSILGNYQQQGFGFNFDIPASTLGIEPNAC